jgi:cytochrome c peroxidase
MKKLKVILFFCTVIGCISKKIYPDAVPVKETYHFEIPKGLIEPDIPADNPLTAGKIELGKMLFFEKSLSKDGSVSCASCHNPEQVFCEKLPLSSRTQVAANILPDRNAISIINSGYQASLGWDGKFKSLEDQAIGSFQPYGDMGIDIGEAVQRINTGKYIPLFKQVFNEGITTENFGKAIAAYERSLLSGNTRFDQFLFNNDQNAISENEQAGFELFIGKASCITCHDIFHPSVNALGGGVALFTDHRFHNLGIGYANGRMTDPGRFSITQDYNDWGNFKTPSLRNAAITPPYMHDGSLKTLEEVVAFYNKGGNANPNISPGLKELLLTKKEIADLVSFIKTLTDEKWTPKPVK